MGKPVHRPRHRARQASGHGRGLVAEATAEDILALAQEIDVAAAEAIPAVAAVVVTTREEADLLRRRGAPLRMTEESTLSPQATTSESDL